MKIVNHSNRQPIGNKLIVFLDQIPNIKKSVVQGGAHMWFNKETDVIGITDQMRWEKMQTATTGIVMAIGANAFKDIKEDEKPRIGDRVTFTGYSGMRKEEGDLRYCSLQDTEIHDYYIPQRKLLK